MQTASKTTFISETRGYREGEYTIKRNYLWPTMFDWKLVKLPPSVEKRGRVGQGQSRNGEFVYFGWGLPRVYQRSVGKTSVGITISGKSRSRAEANKQAQQAIESLLKLVRKTAKK